MTPQPQPGTPRPSHPRHGSATPAPPHPGPHSPAQAGHCRGGGTADPVCALDLDLPGLALVGSLRAWVAPLLRPGERHPDWRGPLLALRAPAAVVFAWHRLLSAVSVGAARPVEVRCPRCLGLSPDEARLLRVVAALATLPVAAPPLAPGRATPVEGVAAARGRALAEAELAALLRPEARAGAVTAAAELAAALAAAGLSPEAPPAGFA